MNPNSGNFPQGDILPVLITVDVCDGAFDRSDRKSRFADLIDSLPIIKKALSDFFRNIIYARIPVTWFVRADLQVAACIGNVCGLFESLRDFIADSKKEGGEIGWHPHLYEKSGELYKPILDPVRMADEAESIWRKISDSGLKIVSSRIGEGVCSNELMDRLNSFGILFDSTALPGRYRDDASRKFDWRITPPLPYNPLRTDYRAASDSTDTTEGKTGRILEIPFSMAEIRAPYDSTEAAQSPPKRYLDLSFETSSLIKGIIPIAGKIPYLMLVIHPLQAIGKEIPSGGLVTGGIDNLNRNLAEIYRVISESGRSADFITVSELGNLWRNMGTG